MIFLLAVICLSGIRNREETDLMLLLEYRTNSKLENVNFCNTFLSELKLARVSAIVFFSIYWTPRLIGMFIKSGCFLLVV